MTCQENRTSYCETCLFLKLQKVKIKKHSGWIRLLHTHIHGLDFRTDIRNIDYYVNEKPCLIYSRLQAYSCDEIIPKQEGQGNYQQNQLLNGLLPFNTDCFELFIIFSRIISILLHKSTHKKVQLVTQYTLHNNNKGF